MQADLAIIGGDVNDRLRWGIDLRRRGLVVDFPTAERKRDKQYKAALQAVGGNRQLVLDLDRAADRSHLQQLLCAAFRVETRRVLLASGGLSLEKPLAVS